MRGMISGLCLTMMAFGSSAVQAQEAGDVIGNIKQFCSAKWPTDYSMQEYCINKQVVAFDAIRPVIVAKGDPAETAIAVSCYAKWTKVKNQPDWSMVNYCYNKQIAAFRRLKGN